MEGYERPPFEITPRILALYGTINETLGKCSSLLLVKPEARLRRENRIKTIHSSLAIEGNSLAVEYITALLNEKPVAGPEKDVREAQNAIRAYDALAGFNPLSVKDFLRAHGVLMAGVLKSAGKFRRGGVGIFRGSEVAHIAPPHSRVSALMDELFFWLKNDTGPAIVKSCVFHYETEFIHPFEDGNGRMGRFWQTRVLMTAHPVFEYVPVEAVVRQNQAAYYKALSRSDETGASTAFVEFMLAAIDTALRETLEQSVGLTSSGRKRGDYTLPLLDGWFDRKAYMRVNRGISAATASRDLKQLVKEGRLETRGEKRTVQYRRID